MIARVVERPFVRWPDIVASLASGAGLLAIVLDDLFHLGLVPFAPRAGGQVLVIGLLVGAACAPWLAPRSRPERRTVRVERGAVWFGRKRIEASEVSAVRVARAERGLSIAVARGTDVVFVEVERDGDARRIADALGRKDGPLSIPAGSPRLHLVRVVLGGLALVAAVLYASAITSGMPVAKVFPGIAGVALANLVAIGSLAIRRDHRPTPWGRHAELHLRRREIALSEEKAPSVSIPTRGEETARVWLARVDAAPAALAYRSSESPEQLWEFVRDDGAEVDLRVGAARILHRRHRANARELIDLVTDDEVRTRVALAVSDDDGDAAERIDRLDPLFRHPPAP